MTNNWNTAKFYTNWWDGSNTKMPYIYGSGLVIPHADSNHRSTIFGACNSSNLWYGYSINSGVDYTWSRIVMESGTWNINISGTATYATCDSQGNNIYNIYVKATYPYTQSIISPFAIGESNSFWIWLRGISSGCSISFNYDSGGVTLASWDGSGNAKIYGVLQNGSSIKTKKDIKLLSFSENIIDKLAPISFKYKEHTDNKTHFGLIYEDTINLIPEICDENKDGYKTINYVELVPILLKEIQNLRARVKTLEQK